MAAVPVVVFSDFTCPFSYVTEAALRRLERDGAARLAHHAFELHPAPAPLPPPSADDVEAARPLAEALGLPLRVPASTARTRKAHEAARFAETRGVGAAMREAIFAAYFAEERDVGRIDVLVELGAALGLDPSELKVVLDVDTFADEVERGRAAARQLRIDAVPALVVGEGERARLLLGAYPVDELRAALAAAAV
ncbi:MAG TPA: DsbA family protein [Longimicrobium sp.]|nr:DsbA family protein [Longimicrobium sp.]